nr:MAG TPA: hypothetical protein [Caudoviricetes sp.]
MNEQGKEFIHEMRIEVSQKRIVKLIEAKNTIKEVIHYDPIEKSKYKTIVNLIDEVIVDELKDQERSMLALRQ